MSHVVTRRAVLCGAAGIAAGSVATSVALAQAKPAPAAPGLAKLEESEAMAKTFAYYHDAKKVDAKKYPNYKPGQLCANCLQVRGKDGDAWRPCAIFPKNVVNANGWCKVYVAKKK
jgi:High potential iron-sulfur protein